MGVKSIYNGDPRGDIFAKMTAIASLPTQQMLFQTNCAYLVCEVSADWEHREPQLDERKKCVQCTKKQIGHEFCNAVCFSPAFRSDASSHFHGSRFNVSPLLPTRDFIHQNHVPK